MVRYRRTIGCWFLVVSSLPLAFAFGAEAGDEKPVESKDSESALSQPDGPDRGDIRWEHFSDKGRVFEPLLADPREAQLRIGYLKDKHGDSFFDLGFGADATLLYGQLAENREVSVTVRGLIASRFEFFSESFDLFNTDYRGGLAIGHREGSESFEIFVYHQSSHLGDEILERGDRTRIDYSRETFRFLYSTTRIDGWRVYGGPSLHYRADPKDIQGRTTLQLGLEHTFTIMNTPAYVAVDMQSKHENDWDIKLAAQFGIGLGKHENFRNHQRLFVEVFNGFSEMGQFYDERELYVLAGISLNF